MPMLLWRTQAWTHPFLVKCLMVTNCSLFAQKPRPPSEAFSLELTHSSISACHTVLEPNTWMPLRPHRSKEPHLTIFMLPALSTVSVCIKREQERMGGKAGQCLFCADL